MAKRPFAKQVSLPSSYSVVSTWVDSRPSGQGPCQPFSTLACSSPTAALDNAVRLSDQQPRTCMLSLLACSAQTKQHTLWNAHYLSDGRSSQSLPSCRRTNGIRECSPIHLSSLSASSCSTGRCQRSIQELARVLLLATYKNLLR